MHRPGVGAAFQENLIRHIKEFDILTDAQARPMLFSMHSKSLIKNCCIEKRLGGTFKYSFKWKTTCIFETILIQGAMPST